eukprot:TRINITY_DN9080_c0_g1_i2.p1 TRINITY_DN9080_c0_g1~~TRINITY_DN9080_c0_g1_i2.p1  ORF type:complete len:779 (-),score=171.42 TRINITY_DN9080_c0_g1_i2:57-2294(-)
MADSTDPAAATSTFVVAVVLNSAIGAIAFLAYSLLHRVSRPTYAPKTLRDPTDEPQLNAYNGFFAWIKGTLQADERTVLQHGGYDAVMNLRVFKFGLACFAVFTLLCCAILIPIYVTSENGVGGIDLLSLSNVATSSPRIAAPFVLTFVLSIVCYVLMYRLFKSYYELRMEYLRQNSAQQYMMLVRDVPIGQRDDESVARYFRELYPHATITAAAIPDLRKLRKLTNERNDEIYKLDRIEKKYAIAQQKAAAKAARQGQNAPQVERPTMRTRKCHKVDAIDHTTAEIARLNAEIKACGDAKTVVQTGSALVAFSRVTSALNARQTDHAAGRSWNTHGAPQPKDVYWNNIYLPSPHRTVRTVLVWIATVALVLLYIIPLTFVSSLTTLDNLMVILPFLRPVVEGVPVLAGFLKGFLPTLAILIFFAVLPAIMRGFSILQGISSHSGLQRGMLSKLFLFFVVNVYFTVLIGSSIFAALPEITNNPSALVQTFGVTIPKVGVFFTTYVMLLALSVFPLRLLGIVRLIVVSLKLKLLATTQHDRDETTKEPEFAEGADLPQQLVVMLISFTYAVLSPIIVPFAMLYYALGYFVQKHHFLLMYKNRYDSGGLWFENFSRRMITVLWIAQFMVMAVLAIKLGPYAAFSLFNIILLVATICIGRYCERVFIKHSREMSMENAKDLVVDDSVPATFIASYTHKCLLAPPLRESEMEGGTTRNEQLEQGVAQQPTPPDVDEARSPIMISRAQEV